MRDLAQVQFHEFFSELTVYAVQINSTNWGKLRFYPNENGRLELSTVYLSHLFSLLKFYSKTIFKTAFMLNSDAGVSL